MSFPELWIFLVCLVVLFGFALARYLHRLKGKPWYTIMLAGTAMFGAGAVLLGATAATLLVIRHLSENAGMLQPVTGPNGVYTVQVSAVNYGGPASEWTAVSLWSKDRQTLEIFRSKNDPHDIKLKWEGENQLEILRPGPHPGEDQAGDPSLYCSDGAYGLAVRCGTYLSGNSKGHGEK